MTKVVYISGPISGLENGNFQKFQDAQNKLEKEGYIVVNPHEIGKDTYKKWSQRLRPEGNLDGQTYDKEMWQDFMKVDIQHLVQVDCVFVLDNWETSKGSRLEILIAQKLGIKVYYMKDYSDFDITLDINKSERIPL